jgi:hypothetical protein
MPWTQWNLSELEPSGSGLEVSLGVMPDTVARTHFLYPLNPKNKKGYVLQAGRKELPTSRDGFFDLLDYDKSDNYGVAKNAQKMKIGDMMWVHFALPHSHLGAVGRVAGEARQQSAGEGHSISIRWDRKLTEKLRQNPIPFSAYRQVPQFSAVTAEPRTARVLNRWLAAKLPPEAKSRDREVGFRTAEVEQRLGQPEFRAELLRAYDGRCAITGCAIPEVLQAAHIKPVKSSGSHSVKNGLLLRADLHNLFDRGLLTINARYVVQIASEVLVDPSYRRFNGKKLRVLPETIAKRPSRKLLQGHHDFFTSSERR